MGKECTRREMLLEEEIPRKHHPTYNELTSLFITPTLHNSVHVSIEYISKGKCTPRVHEGGIEKGGGKLVMDLFTLLFISCCYVVVGNHSCQNIHNIIVSQ